MPINPSFVIKVIINIIINITIDIDTNITITINITINIKIPKNQKTKRPLGQSPTCRGKRKRKTPILQNIVRHRTKMYI